MALIKKDNFINTKYKEELQSDIKTDFFSDPKDERNKLEWYKNFVRLPETIQKHFFEKALKEIKEEDEEKEKKEMKALETQSIKPALSCKAEMMRERLRAKLLKKHNLSK